VAKGVHRQRRIADVHVVTATMDPEAGHRGQGVFIVPKGTPGLTPLRKLDKLGCRASHTGDIFPTCARVPISCPVR
jgi:acyl-CoA dehydrogenase